MQKSRNLAVVLLSVALVLTACGSKKSNKVASTTSTTAAVTSTTTAPSSTTVTTAATPTSVAATSTMSHLVAVRTSAQGNGDQIAFEFDNGNPGYALKVTKSPISGEDGGITVSGSSVYLVTFSTASDVDLSGGLKTYYNGTKDITPTGAKLVTEIKQVSDSEGVLTWAFGGNNVKAVNVSTTTGPSQVIFTVS